MCEVVDVVLDLRTGRSSHPALLMTVITYRPRLICVAAQSNCSAQLAQVDSCSALQLGSVGLGAHSVCVCVECPGLMCSMRGPGGARRGLETGATNTQHPGDRHS